ncbi:MAG: heme o synthase [Candidatus Eremiobacterota bacterium]
MSDSTNTVSPALRATARSLAVCTAVLIFIGATVTTTGSGLAVPDWPLSFGTLFPRMVGGVLFEHGHRLVAGFVGFLTLVLALWTVLARSPNAVRRLAWLALLLVVVQGLLGGLTVLLKLPTEVSVAHGVLAQLFLCTVVALVLVTSPGWNRAGQLDRSQIANLQKAAVAAFLVVILQLVLGAVMRHLGAGLIFTDFPLTGGRVIPALPSLPHAVHFAHRVGALLVCLACGYLIYQCLAFQSDRRLRHPALALIGLLLLQVVLGVLTLWSFRGLVPTCLHVMNGALVLATVFTLLVWAFRLPADVASGPISFQPHGPASPRDWVELTKPRLVMMAAFTAGSSYWLAADGEASWLRLGLVVVGVLIMGAGAAMLNHVLEVDVDARMRRTCHRPLPAGRVNPVAAEMVGGLAAVGGCLFLALAVTPLSGLLAALAVVSYVLVYTPLKRTTELCTLVGAVPGALPVLVGWAGFQGRLEVGGWLLFLILFLWQLPHFMGIAWLCREDYARAGLRVVTVSDRDGALVAAQILIYSMVLIPVSLAPTLCGMAGLTYFLAALLLGVAFLVSGLRMVRERSTLRARQLVLASVVYLPLLYAFLLWNRT